MMAEANWTEPECFHTSGRGWVGAREAVCLRAERLFPITRATNTAGTKPAHGAGCQESCFRPPWRDFFAGVRS